MWSVELFICGLHTPGKLLSGPKAVAIWLVEFSCATVTKSLKEAVADSTWVQSTIAAKYGTRRYLCIGQCGYMGKVNNSNIT